MNFFVAGRTSTIAPERIHRREYTGIRVPEYAAGRKRLEQLAEELLKYPSARDERDNDDNRVLLDVASRGLPTPVGVPFTGRVNYKFDPSLASRRVAFPSKRSLRRGLAGSPRHEIVLGIVRFRRLNIHTEIPKASTDSADRFNDRALVARYTLNNASEPTRYRSSSSFGDLISALR